jgi:hypothetical protein
MADGYGHVATQPSDASEIFVKSTSAADTNTARIEGIITGGYYRTASVTMTGTTAVSLSSTITTFIRITKFYLSVAANGTVTLHEDSGSGTELARLQVGDAHAAYYQVRLYPTPAAAVTYTADILRGLPDMSQDLDEPLIPEDFHDVLIDGAELRELTKQDDRARYQIVRMRYDEGVRALTGFVANHPDWRPQWGGQRTGHSTLGAWYPADTWIG